MAVIMKLSTILVLSISAFATAEKCSYKTDNYGVGVSMFLLTR